MYMHNFAKGGTLLNLGLGKILYIIFVWWVICESTYEKHHTFVVQLRFCLLSLKSCPFQVLFFHSSLAPMVEIGAIWPPKRINLLNPWGIPILNTIFLLSSRAIGTWVHHIILVESKKQVVYTLIATKQLSNYWRNFLLTFCNHTIIDVHNETNATYHLNELEHLNMLLK